MHDLNLSPNESWRDSHNLRELEVQFCSSLELHIPDVDEQSIRNVFVESENEPWPLSALLFSATCSSKFNGNDSETPKIVEHDDHLSQWLK